MRPEACIHEQTIGSAYRTALNRYLEGLDEGHMIVSCSEPVTTSEVPETLDVHDWGINLGSEYNKYSLFDHEHQSPKTGGSTGEDWVNDRIIELHEGMYAERMANPDQIEMIIDRLQIGMHGSCTNALVAQVYRDQDLEMATVHRPSNPGIACVTQLQFRPVRDRLHLHMTLRSQYIDLKGYGNLVAAATLLAKVCARTDYKPGTIVEHLNNVTTYRRRHAIEINESLQTYA
jgi:thymidylate synthase